MKYLITTLLATALTTGGIGFTTLAMASEHGQGRGHHCKHHGGAGSWKASLSDEQSKKLDKLHLDYTKKKYPIKAKLKAAKVDLALLMTADSAKQKDIDSKIDQILKLKGEKMRIKTAHKIEVCNMLTEEQRIQFDMHVLKKAFKGKSKQGCRH